MTFDFGGKGEVTFAREGGAGIIMLTRPKALNALTHTMVLAISRALDAWEHDDDVAVVVIRGEGRAFSAGGDITAIYHAGRAGRPLYDFFADEYRLNARIEAYPKPYVALIDGIVMGGGVGVSIHGSHRIFSERARFAMPEVSIGFFPDVGGSRFLPRLPGNFGTFLGLSGTRVAWGDALGCGLATAAVGSSDFDALLGDLAEHGDVDRAIVSYAIKPARETADRELALIERCFGGKNLADVLDALAGEADEFSEKAMGTMQKCSPTSLHVAFRQIRAGGHLSMRECMMMEYRIVTRMLQGHDFYEGIRAAVIDKDGTPQWRPDQLAGVETQTIDKYFEGLGADELQLADRAGAVVR